MKEQPRSQGTGKGPGGLQPLEKGCWGMEGLLESNEKKELLLNWDVEQVVAK